MYNACTAGFIMLPNGANIVPITYGTVHARNAPARAYRRGIGPCRGHPVQVAQLCAPGARAVVRTQRAGQPRADASPLGATVPFGVPVRIARARPGRWNRSAWRVDQRHATADGRFAFDARSVFHGAPSPLSGEHARRPRLRAAVGHLVSAGDRRPVELRLSRADRGSRRSVLTEDVR